MHVEKNKNINNTKICTEKKNSYKKKLYKLYNFLNLHFSPCMSSFSYFPWSYYY